MTDSDPMQTYAIALVDAGHGVLSSLLADPGAEPVDWLVAASSIATLELAAAHAGLEIPALAELRHLAEDHVHACQTDADAGEGGEDPAVAAARAGIAVDPREATRRRVRERVAAWMARRCDG